MNGAASAASFFLRLISVPKCVICGEVLADNGEVCPHCLEIWSRAIRRRCPVCGKSAVSCTCRPFSLSDADSIGSAPLMSLVFFGKADSTDLRDEAVRRLIYRVKRSTDHSSLRFAARELSLAVIKRVLKSEDSDSWRLTYPPRCSGERRRYGFDQARLLAGLISRYTGIPLEKCFIRRGGSAQKTLNNMLERRTNAEGSILSAGRGDFSGRNYIIIDDVITTGATVNTCASLLKQGGAKSCVAVSIARTIRKKRRVRRKPSDKPWFARPRANY